MKLVAEKPQRGYVYGNLEMLGEVINCKNEEKDIQAEGTEQSKGREV